MASLRKLALIAKHGRKAVLAATAQEQRSRTGRTAYSFPRKRRSTRGLTIAPWLTKAHTPSRLRDLLESQGKLPKREHVVTVATRLYASFMLTGARRQKAQNG